MTNEFAAELQYAHAAADTDPSDLDKLGVRDLLIAIQAAEDELAELEELKQQIVGRYESTENRLKQRIEQMRGSVMVWIERMNEGEKVSFPDAGTAFIQTRPPNVRIVNDDMFEEWARMRGHVGVMTSIALGEARRLHKEGAELPPGTDLSEATSSLSIRRPS